MKRARLLVPFLASAVVLLAAGCGTSPTAPPPTTTAQAPSLPVLLVSADGTAGFMQADSVVAVAEVADPSLALQVSKEVDGSKGGWLQCGRFLLTVPPGAFDSVATITMSMRDSTAMVVDLGIAPASRNKFNLPVVLACNTTGLAVPADSVSLYWYNPAAVTWVGMTSTKTLVPATDCVQQLAASGESCPDLSSVTDGVTTQLQHFSTYSAGKAGW